MIDLPLPWREDRLAAVLACEAFTDGSRIPGIRDSRIAGASGHRGYFHGGSRGGADNVNDDVRMGEHRDMAAVHGASLCIHALGCKALQVRVNRAIVIGHDV